MKTKILTLLAIGLIATTSIFAQLEITTDARTVTSQVYLQFEGTEIIPSGVTGITSVDPGDSTYILNPKGMVAQEANKIVVDGDENVLWLDYDGHLKVDSTLLNKEHFSFACDIKWNGANSVWYMGIYAFVGFDINRVVAEVPTPGYVNRHVQMANPAQHKLNGAGVNTLLFPAKDMWEHLVLTYDTGVVKWYIADSLVSEGSETLHKLRGLELFLGHKATVNSETGIVTPGRGGSNENKQTQLYLDDVAIFDVTLTAEEVSKVYAASNGETASLRSHQLETLSAYPNPVMDILHLENSKATSVAIYSLTGKMMQQSQVNNATVGMSQLASGLYFIKALDANHQAIASLKVMKR